MQKKQGKITILILIIFLFLMTSTPLTVFAGGWNTATLLSAVTATGASTAYELPRAERKTFYITGASTPVATVLVQSSPDNVNWVTLATVSVSVAGTTEVAVNGFLHRYVRTNVSGYTSGAITVVLGWD